MTQEFIPVGTVTRMGKRFDGEPWHYARFKEDGSIDLPPRTQLFVRADALNPNNPGAKNGINDNQAGQVLPKAAD